jgi:hypothetical protein
MFKSMSTVFHVMIASCVFHAACNIPEKICETDEKDNVCNSVDDCLVAYCASDCTKCAAVYSKKQVQEAWCLTPIDEEPNARCRKAAEATCTPSSLPPTCPRYIVPACEENKCIPVFQPP